MAADLVAEVAPYITKSRTERVLGALRGLGKRGQQAAQASPHLVVKLVRTTVESVLLASRAKLREDVEMLKQVRQVAKAKKASGCEGEDAGA